MDDQKPGLGWHVTWIRVEWNIKIFELKKVVLIYGPKYRMKYFYHNFEFLHPLVAVQFDRTGFE